MTDSIYNDAARFVKRSKPEALIEEFRRLMTLVERLTKANQEQAKELVALREARRELQFDAADNAERAERAAERLDVSRIGDAEPRSLEVPFTKTKKPPGKVKP